MLTERRIENPETLKLQEMFSHPLDTVDDLVIESSSEAEEYIHQIENKLSNRDDWSARADGIKLALSCLKGGICDYINTDYSFFVSDVAGCVSDLRSTLVRNGSLLIAASAQFFREKYMTSIKILIPALFKQLNHGTAVISNSCRFALLSIAQYVQHPKTLAMFVSRAQSKSSQHKVVVAEALITMLNSWPTSLICSSRTSFDNTLNNLKDDASQLVRKYARIGLDYFKGENAPVNENVCNDLSKKTLSTPKSPRSMIPNRGTPSSLRRNKNTPKRNATPNRFTSNANKFDRNNKKKDEFDDDEYPPIKEIKTPQFHKPLGIDSISPSPSPSPSPGKRKRSRTPNQRPRPLAFEQKKRSAIKRKSMANEQLELNDDDDDAFIPIPNDDTEENFVPNQQLINSSRQTSRPITPSRKNSKIPNFSRTPTPTKASTPRIPNRQKEVTPTVNKTQTMVTPKRSNKKPAKKKVIIENDIDSYMPPKKMDEAENFQNCIIEIIEADSYESFNGLEDLLCPSIIAAANFIPQIEEWDSILPCLFQKYPESFKENAMKLIIAFRCDEWLVMTSIEYFGSQYLIDEFAACRSTQLQYAFKFFVVVISQHVEFDISDKLAKLLRRLADMNRGTEGAEIITS